MVLVWGTVGSKVIVCVTVVVSSVVNGEIVSKARVVQVSVQVSVINVSAALSI